jgi:hypothetical protein
VLLRWQDAILQLRPSIWRYRWLIGRIARATTSASAFLIAARASGEARTGAALSSPQGITMTTEHTWPTWASELFETIVASIESKGMGSFQGAYYEDEGTHQIEVAPALAQLARAGPDDGATVWALIHNVDLLAIQQAFDQVGWVGMLLDNEDGSPELSVEGELQGRHVLVTIYAKPFDDAEVESVIRG